MEHTTASTFTGGEYQCHCFRGISISNIQLSSRLGRVMQNQSMPTSQLSSQSKRSSYVNYNKVQTPTTSGQQQQQVWPSSLPTGWKREECMRPNGLGTGKSDVYYISPQNQVVRNKQEMQAILGDKYDIALFDWRMGKFSPNLRSKGVKNKRQMLHQPKFHRTDVKSGNLETPHQLFWEKRLANNVAVNPDTGEPFKSISLPKGMQSAGVPGYQSAQLIQSLIHALSKKPCVTINHLQPMIKTFIVTDDDIRRQEARVKELRKKLETARKKLHPRYDTEREG
ncbi:unnamed protein product [Heterobilharzia americana]|nr:unnamed protein product [Heterobilharzia americana]